VVTAPHRNPRPLIFGWTITLVLEALIYWIVTNQPVSREVLTPGYVLAAVPAAIATWHWLHRRRSHHDRREGDRRHEERRQD
jgi:hypothetical protein